MATMKAVRMVKPLDLRLMDVEIPEIGPHDVLCRVVRAGMCGTDYAIYSGEFSFVKSGDVPFPMTLGHEWSGVVAKTGSDVMYFSPGDRVVGDTAVACGHCHECLVGQYGLCKHCRAVGTIRAWDGAYAQYILMPERHLMHLPANVDFDNGAFVEPAATALLAVKRAEVGISDTVLVIGSGPIGIAAAKLAKLCGAAKVAIAARKDYKLKAAMDLGVDGAINTTRMSLKDGIKEQFGEWGVDKIVEASGSTAMFAEALKVINTSGAMSVVAFYEKTLEHFDIDRMVFGDVRIIPSAGSLGMYRPILRLMERGILDLRPLITARYRLGDVPQAMKDMKGKNETRIKMMIEQD